MAEHGRLIDADALIEELNASHFPGAPYVDAGISIAIGKICDAPTIEPQRTGKWIKITTGAMREKYMCSVCGRTVEEDGIERLVPIRYPFCHCGAKMRKEEMSE